MDIHLTAATSAVHQSYEWVRFAPTIGITLYPSSDTLYVVKGFLVDNRLMGRQESGYVRLITVSQSDTDRNPPKSFEISV